MTAFETVVFDLFVCLHDSDLLFFVAFINVTELVDRIERSLSKHGIKDPYKWNFALVIAWSAHLDPADNTLLDISPASLGNTSITSYPSSFEEYQNFYNFSVGGSIGSGHEINPITGMAYTPQMVKKSDYARVLAEFWADGPDSETPPGHWFTILNYVNDHPETIKRFAGQGAILSNLEWDVKSYLVMGGAMHDAAINTWGIKGYYDYVRPISAIRYMASKGQSTDNTLPSFNPHGLPLIPDLIEVIASGDDLAGDNDINVGKIKATIVPLPSLEETVVIIEKVNALLALCDELEQQIETSNIQIEQLMQSCVAEALA